MDISLCIIQQFLTLDEYHQSISCIRIKDKFDPNKITCLPFRGRYWVYWYHYSAQMGKTANEGQIESIKGSKIWPIQEGQKVLTEVEIY